ncbi:MAG: hypothetical protein ACRD8O_15200 [Bryobacteraceae bacterium]
MTKLPVLLAACALLCFGEDGDGDKLTDNFEQELLLKFAPAFFVSQPDCDGLPAEFLAGSHQPRVVAKNGTLYGQVFPRGEMIEIHYYHLWNRDCGRMGHALDVEHVSVLLRADSMSAPAAAWKALYWYSGAHEGTACELSSAAKASTLHAEFVGPTVWISDGKHASFLSQDACGRGCGGDRCAQMVRLTPANLINIGEPGAPLNGAVWTGSESWQLASKMKTDFSGAVIVQLENAGTIVAINAPRPPIQAVAAAGNTSLRHTGNALSTADAHTDRALDRSLKSAGRSLRRARQAVEKWVRRN